MKKETLFWTASILFGIVALLGLGSSVYFFQQYRQSQEQLTASSILPQTDASIVSKVQQLIILPEEEAKIMVVQNVDELKKTQRFFSDALDGDTVLIFANAKKAVIYRSSINRIVNVAPILAGDSQETTSAGTSASASGQSAK